MSKKKNLICPGGSGYKRVKQKLYPNDYPAYMALCKEYKMTMDEGFEVLSYKSVDISLDGPELAAIFTIKQLRKIHRKPMNHELSGYCYEAFHMNQKALDSDLFMRATPVVKSILSGVYTGAHMEKVSSELELTRDEMKALLDDIKKLSNDIVKIQNVFEPKLLDLIKDIRSKRQALNVELSSMLRMMKDIRKFFLENEHSTQMALLGEFIGVLGKLKGFIDDGTMDAIVDMIVKLEINKGEAKNAKEKIKGS